ncbi:hypothetical protein PspLS_10397 [Pyricularia sp. CBS 133598]|nr:hypothetical protein PspLS_10397 [Pyricularia sp. CBS 133598]
MAADSVPTEPLPKCFCFRGCHPAECILCLWPYHWSHTSPKNLATSLFCAHHEDEFFELLPPSVSTSVESFHLDDLDETSQSQTSPDKIVSIIPSWLHNDVGTMPSPPSPPLAVLDPAIVLTIEKCPGGRIYQSATSMYFVSESEEEKEEDDAIDDDDSLSSWLDGDFDDDNIEISSSVTDLSEYASGEFDHAEFANDDLLNIRTVLARERADLLVLGYGSEWLHDLYYAAEFILVSLNDKWDEDLCRGFHLLNEEIDAEIQRLQKPIFSKVLRH